MAARAFLLVLTVTLSSCGAEAVVGPLIVLTNTWRNETNQNHTFSINDDTQGTPRRSGHFTGNENVPGAAQPNPFSGFWNTDGHVEFTVQRAGGAVRYTGRLTDNLNRMELTSSAGNLVLIRPVN
jgi:hypothetical protein